MRDHGFSSSRGGRGAQCSSRQPGRVCAGPFKVVSLVGGAVCDWRDTYPVLSLSSRRNRCGSVEDAVRRPVPAGTGAGTAGEQANSRAAWGADLPVRKR